jgi:hypothetical protein
MLVQAGSISNSGPGAIWNIGEFSGTEAFFESYPKESAQIINELTIHAGDSMFVSVLQSTGGTVVDYIVCDTTTNESAYPSETLSGDEATTARQAEYIVERPVTF